MQVSDFYSELIEQGIDFFCGVPDSLLKDFCAYVTDNNDSMHNVICANEGNAVALAAGHYLASRKPGLVYMQNSGLGNAVNPLLSLIDEDVYELPVLFLIGWRGEPEIKDEPQHKKQGKLTLPLLETMQLSHGVLSSDMAENKTILAKAFSCLQQNKPYALVVRKGVFEKYSLSMELKTPNQLSRENAIEIIAEKIGKDAVVISTTGMISRELFEYRTHTQQGHQQDFLTVGSMGHASSIALGIAIEKNHKPIYCLEGDGALLMHLGAIAINASLGLKNFKHIVLNNEAHDSVGGQPTVAGDVDFCAIAKASGYVWVHTVNNAADLKNIVDEFVKISGPAFLEVKVKKGARADLGRPTRTTIENRNDFMAFLNERNS